jgi:uncharacterized membrane protein
MVIYHAAYDLQVFHGWDIDVMHGNWKVFQIAVASLFLIVSGISAGFWTRTNAFGKGWRRGWLILSTAMLVSLVTAIVDERTWVRFGILHLLALAAFVLPFLRRIPPFALGLLGLAVIALTPFDLMPAIVSVDYVPPIPWLGPVVLGFAIGIPLSKRPRPSIRTRKRVLLDALAWPGRHSLAIYLLHQPILLALLYAIFS